MSSKSGNQETTCAETNQKNKTDHRHEGEQERDQTGSEQQGGGDRRDKESESEEVVDVGPRQEVRAKNVRQCRDSGIGKRERDQTPAAEMRVGLLNVRSMRNKTSEILNIITQKNLDVFATTETWLQKNNADSVLQRASPQNFSFYYEVRDGRGGGVAIQFVQALQGEQIHFGSKTTFEYVASVLTLNEWDTSVPFINVYYPPGYNKAEFRVFLNQFETLLKSVKNFSSIIVTGDFNIQVDAKTRSFTDEFYHLFPIYDLVQHVKEPTHEKGHTLDLVITRNTEISDLFVRNDGVSDHFTVYFRARPKDSKKKPEDKVDQDEQAKQIRKTEE